MTSETKIPDISQYNDYRLFLRDWLEHKKSVRKQFSLRLLTKRAGLKSAGFLTLVMAGKKNLTTESGIELAKAMSLTPEQSDYFVALIMVSAAHNETAKEQAASQLLRAKAALRRHGLPDVATDDLRERWYFSVVLCLILLPDFEPSGKWISNKLRNLVTPEEAEDCLATLKNHGLLVAGEGGKFVIDDSIFVLSPKRTTPVPVGTLNWLSIVQKILPTSLPAERALSLNHFAFNSKQLELFRQKIRKFSEEMIELAREQEAEADCVASLGVLLVPMTNKQ